MSGVSGKFVVIARHPWAKSDEKYCFAFDGESSEEAEVSARGLIDARTASGFTCTLHKEQNWKPETFKSTVEVGEKPTADLHDDTRNQLEAFGARYIDQTIEYWETDATLSEISTRDSIPYATFTAAMSRNCSMLQRLDNKRDNERLKIKHEKLVGNIMALIDRGAVGLIDLFFTVIDRTLVQQLRDSGVERVEQLQQGIDLIKANKDQWMPNDLEYLTYTKDRIEGKEWVKAFPIIGESWSSAMPYPEWGE